MQTPVAAASLEGVPVSELATGSALRGWQDTLRSAGTHCRNGDWIVAGPADVQAALASPALQVAPPPGPAGPAAGLLARMARFSTGPAHQDRRDLLIGLLPPVPVLVMLTSSRVREYVRHRAGPFDLMPMARQLPGEVLGLAMGLPAEQARQVAVLTGRICDQVTPVLTPRPAGRADADEAVTELLALLGETSLAGTTPAGARTGAPAGLAAGDVAVAAASILFQAREATAALIGLTMLAAGARPSAAGGGGLPQAAGLRVEHVLRHDAPVQNTRRTAVAPAVIGGATLPAGAPVWIFLPTAEQGTGWPATFGRGPHACPGAAQATAIARQVATVLDLEGWRPAPGQRTGFEPRPSLRVPQQLLVSRA